MSLAHVRNSSGFKRCDGVGVNDGGGDSTGADVGRGIGEGINEDVGTIEGVGGDYL